MLKTEGNGYLNINHVKRLYINCDYILDEDIYEILADKKIKVLEFRKLGMLLRKSRYIRCSYNVIFLAKIPNDHKEKKNRNRKSWKMVKYS